MPSFTTRVELHDADWSDYETLHKKMAVQGFSRTITSDDGKRYSMPPAEYNIEGAFNRSDVLAKAKSSAGQVKTHYAVFVTESAGRTWSGLDAA
jgi:ABC-type glycerol-3-phosphate transport system substrate-binding protein